MQGKRLSERVAQWESRGSAGQQPLTPKSAAPAKVESPVRLFGAGEEVEGCCQDSGAV